MLGPPVVIIKLMKGKALRKQDFACCENSSLEPEKYNYTMMK